MFVTKNLDYKLLKCKFPKKRHLLHAFCPNPVWFCSPSLVVHTWHFFEKNESSHSTAVVL